MSAHNHDEELIKQTIGGNLQEKADKAKDEKIRFAIFQTDIKGLSREKAANKLKNAIDDALDIITNNLKIFELAYDGEKTWIAARTIIEAIQTYCSITGMDLVEFEGDEEITELPKKEWAKHFILGEDGLPEQSFKDWMKKNNRPDIIAGTMY